MEFVLCESSCVPERLTDILLLEIWEISDDLRRCHPVGYQVDDVGDRNPESADSGSA